MPPVGSIGGVYVFFWKVKIFSALGIWSWIVNVYGSNGATDGINYTMLFHVILLD